MQNIQDIQDKLLSDEMNLSKHCILYECAGDYVRGWVDALKWVLGPYAASQSSDSVDDDIMCPTCDDRIKKPGHCYNPVCPDRRKPTYCSGNECYGD